MWPTRIENPRFLLDIYGHYPQIDDVEVSEVLVGWDGPTLLLSFISQILPYKPPPKWETHNRVLFRLRYFDVEEIQLTAFKRSGRTSVKMWDEGGRVAAVCDGSVQLSVRSRWLYVDKISALLVQETT